MVFADALTSYFHQLRQIATEIDEEFASEPEPIVRPSCLVALAKEVQVIMRTLPSVSQMVAQLLRGLHRGTQANSTA